MKLAILVIASKGEPYDSFVNNWISYPFPDWIKVWHVFLEEDLEEEVVVTEHCIRIRGTECLRPGIHLKTVAAMKWITENYEYDVLLRSNLSSWYNLEVLHNWLAAAPKEGHMFGCLMAGIFLSGCGYAMTRDVVKRFYEWEAEDHVNLFMYPDDILVYIFMTKEQIPVKLWNIVEVNEQCPIDHAAGAIHCRFKLQDKRTDELDLRINAKLQREVMRYQLELP